MYIDEEWYLCIIQYTPAIWKGMIRDGIMKYKVNKQGLFEEIKD